jgi:hypothetical protein
MIGYNPGKVLLDYKKRLRKATLKTNSKKRLKYRHNKHEERDRQQFAMAEYIHHHQQQQQQGEEPEEEEPHQ